MEDYLKIIRQCVLEDKNFDEALDLVKANSLGGDIWVVGSFLYKNILKSKYGIQNLLVKDYDFMLEKQRDYSETVVLPGWTKEDTYYGGPRFFNGRFGVDVYPIGEALKNFSIDCADFDYEKMMRAYLQGTIFDVQAIAYNYSKDFLVDEGALNAIEERKSRVTCVDSCVGISKKKGISIEEYLDYKSRDLGVEVFF